MQYVCLFFDLIECLFKDGVGNFFDFLFLLRYSDNWEVIIGMGDLEYYFINVCKFLVLQVGIELCFLEVVVCLLGGFKFVNFGRVRDGFQWRDGIIVLKYVDGDLCLDGIWKKLIII